MNETDGKFLEELESFMDKVKVVRKADMVSDCCGRTYRTRNVVTLPESARAEFEGLIKPHRSISALEDGDEHCIVTYDLVEGRTFDIPDVTCDYDGFLEVDYTGLHIECSRYAYVTVSMRVKGPVPQRDWRTGVHDVPGIQIHPVDGIKGFSVQTYDYGEFFHIDHPWNKCDETVFCFLEKKEEKK